jgi:hypothetical protein
MRRTLPILFAAAAGCASQAPAPGTAEHSSPPPVEPTFKVDTYYTGILQPYTSPEACQAANPSSVVCHLELGFCAGGVAAFSNFDLPEAGSYFLNGTLVIATFPSDSADEPALEITLDTTTGAATNAQADTYILDTAGRWGTLQFDTGYNCPDE